jgi:hypothetical protein
MEPSVKLTYFLNLDKPWKMPDMWPFNGRELRIKQNFRLDNRLTASLRRETQGVLLNQPTESGSDTYTLLNQVGWDLLENVKTNFTLEQKYFHDIFATSNVANQSSDYYTIQVKLGLEATF